MIAYKFLRPGRVGPFSHFHWPEPGAWVRSGSEVDACARGIHACRIADLPWWLAEELWEVQLEGDVGVADRKLVATHGRLVARVEAWTPDRAREFAQTCAWRTRDLAIDALVRAGHQREATRLARCTTLDRLVAITSDLLPDAPGLQIILTIAREGALEADAGAAPTCAYIAAHAARRLDGPAGSEAERARQSDWLTDHLGLHHFGPRSRAPAPKSASTDRNNTTPM